MTNLNYKSELIYKIMNTKLLCLCALSLFLTVTAYSQEVAPMVKANFSQSEPFNDLCPHSAAAGCGPVAIAEILSYYKSPEHGIGTVTYVNTKNDETISENLDDFYFDWDNILDNYVLGEYTDTEALSVAKLVYSCGVTMNVTYGLSTSTTNKHRMVYNLQHHLFISPESRYLNREHYSTAEWIEMLNSQLTSGHPVFYRGTNTHSDNSEVGHMFVIDGVNESGLYHANWGHGGKGNKFTDLNVLNQGAEDGLPGGKNVCYNFKQAMMINCYPVDDVSELPLQWCDLMIPITLNDDETVNQVKVKLGQSFKLGTKVTNCASDACDVNYKWSLLQDGEEVKSLASGQWSNFTPFYNVKIEKFMSIPSSISNGEYTLVLMTKSSLAPEWQLVRDNPINMVDVIVKDGFATVIVPDQYKGDPELYLSSDVALTYGANASGLDILCDLINPTDNNYEGKFKVEVTTDNSSYSYEPAVCIYGNTNVKYRFSISNSKLDLTSSTVKSVNLWYIYGDKEIALTTTRPNNVSSLTGDNYNGDIIIYNLQGHSVAVIKHGQLESMYNDILSSLPKGIYIIKDGNKTRKLIK